MSNSANPAYNETANRLTILMQSGLSQGIRHTQRSGEFEAAMDGSLGENGCPAGFSPHDFMFDSQPKDGCPCVVERCGSSVGAIPTRQRSLQPIAIGMAVDVTKPSKPSRQHAV